VGEATGICIAGDCSADGGGVGVGCFLARPVFFFGCVLRSAGFFFGTVLFGLVAGGFMSCPSCCASVFAVNASTSTKRQTGRSLLLTGQSIGFPHKLESAQKANEIQILTETEMPTTQIEAVPSVTGRLSGGTKCGRR